MRAPAHTADEDLRCCIGLCLSHFFVNCQGISIIFLVRVVLSVPLAMAPVTCRAKTATVQ